MIATTEKVDRTIANLKRCGCWAINELNERRVYDVTSLVYVTIRQKSGEWETQTKDSESIRWVCDNQAIG